MKYHQIFKSLSKWFFHSNNRKTNGSVGYRDGEYHLVFSVGTHHYTYKYPSLEGVMSRLEYYNLKKIFLSQNPRFRSELLAAIRSKKK